MCELGEVATRPRVPFPERRGGDRVGPLDQLVSLRPCQVEQHGNGHRHGQREVVAVRQEPAGPAQDLGSNLGKVFRLRDDGSAAPDNPFADQVERFGPTRIERVAPAGLHVLVGVQPRVIVLLQPARLHVHDLLQHRNVRGHR